MLYIAYWQELGADSESSSKQAAAWPEPAVGWDQIQSGKWRI